MPKKKPDKLKLKIIIEVDKSLYDRITKEAKKRDLPGTIEDTLKNNCILWFRHWEEMIKQMDTADNVVEVTKPGLIGTDGKPLGKA